MLKFIIAITFSIILCFASSAGKVFALPTPQSTIAPNVPVHALVYQVIGNCYHMDNTIAFNNGCNAPVASPGPAGASADMTALANYVNYAEVDSNSMEGIRLAGIKGVFYSDPFIIHGPILYPGLSRSTLGGTTTTYCPNTIPMSVLLQNAGAYGYPFNAPAYNNGVVCNSLYYGSVFGGVSQASQNFWEQVFEVSIGFQPINGLGGLGELTGSPFQVGVDDIREDDADYPGDRFANTYICQGYPASQGSSPGSPTSCATYGSQSVATRALNPLWQSRPYPYFMAPQWVTGMWGMLRMPSTFGAKAIFNDYTNPLFYQYFNNSDRSNVDVAQCEGCFVHTSGNFWNESVWQDHVNAEIVAETWGVKFDAFHPTESTVADSILNYASLMIGTVDPNLSMITDEIGGATTPNSGISITPLVYIVPTQPLNTPRTFAFDPIQNNYVPNQAKPYTTFGVGALKTSTGVYLREWSKCYNGSTGTPVAFGGCAVVIVPNGATGATMPATVGTYTRTATYTGSGIITPSQFGGGDTGVLSLTGSAPPAAGAALTANTAYILTP